MNSGASTSICVIHVIHGLQISCLIHIMVCDDDIYKPLILRSITDTAVVSKQLVVISVAAMGLYFFMVGILFF